MNILVSDCKMFSACTTGFITDVYSSRKDIGVGESRNAKLCTHISKLIVALLIMAALCNRGAIIFLPYSFFLSSIFFFFLA